VSESTTAPLSLFISSFLRTPKNHYYRKSGVNLGWVFALPVGRRALTIFGLN
jgi:hypothetical protein